MSGQSPEGWYPDPYSPSLLRWWDGERWSDHTRDAEPDTPPGSGWATPGPGVPPYGGPAGHGGPGVPPYPASGQGPPMGAPPRRSPAAWVLGGVAALVVIAVLVGLGVATNAFGVFRGDLPPDAGSPAPATPSGAPGGIVQGDRLMDQASGLSFKLLPKPWQRATTEPGEPWSTGQYRIAQADYDADGDGEPDGDYVASVYCGELPERYTYTGAAGLRGTTAELARSFLTDVETYPRPNRVDVTGSRAMKIGDHRAWVITAKLTFPTAEKHNWKWSAEDTAFLVVDKGAARPAAMYISIPDNVQGTSVKDVLKTVRITS